MKHTLRLMAAMALLALCTNAAAQRYGKVIDKTIAVVGNEMIKISDLEQEIQVARSQGGSSDEKARCELLERMLESKLFLLQARLDSLSVNQDMVESQLAQQIDRMRTGLGGDEAVEEYFTVAGRTYKDMATNSTDFKKTVTFDFTAYEKKYGSAIRKMNPESCDISDLLTCHAANSTGTGGASDDWV